MIMTENHPGISIIGAGAWGAALAINWAKAGYAVRLWVREKDLAERMKKTRENDLYLPGFSLPDAVEIHTDAAACVEDARLIISATPVQNLRTVTAGYASAIRRGAAFIICSKGLERSARLRVSQVAEEVLPKDMDIRIGILSGPSFAGEVARGLPTAVVLASKDVETARQAQKWLSTNRFRIYTNQDVIGVEIAGALKNVIAIATGVVRGLNLGENTKAALITRGLAEISRLGVALGANAITFQGLAGIGDLALTCNSPQSRNYRVGLALAERKNIETVLHAAQPDAQGEDRAEGVSVAEGVETVSAALDLAKETGVDLPISREVHAILFAKKDPEQAVNDLMVRDLRQEFYWL